MKQAEVVERRKRSSLPLPHNFFEISLNMILLIEKKKRELYRGRFDELKITASKRSSNIGSKDQIDHWKGLGEDVSLAERIGEESITIISILTTSDYLNNCACYHRCFWRRSYHLRVFSTKRWRDFRAYWGMVDAKTKWSMHDTELG